MNKKDFNNCIVDILNEKKIESLPLINIETLKFVLTSKEVTKELFRGFKKNYEIEYGDELECFLMKVQDMVYRIHLLVNHNLYNNYGITDKNVIKDVVLKFTRNNTDIFDAVSYDDSDMEIVENQDIDVRDLLSIKKI